VVRLPEPNCSVLPLSDRAVLVYTIFMMKNETAPVKYYVGDLCYVMHDVWQEVCLASWDEDFDGEGELEDGRKFILFHTAYGDGQYNDQNGLPYSVDSGTIGAIRVDDIRDPEFTRIVENGLGHVHEFPAEIDGMDCFYEDGTIHIYTVVIETGDSDYDDEGEDLEEGFDPYDGCYTGDC
jgi:hypothetical protein